MKRLVFFFFLFGMMGCSTSQFVVHETLPLDQGHFNTEGKIEVLRDERLTRDDIKKCEEGDLEENTLGYLEDLPKFKNNPVKNAQLVFIDQNNHVLQTLELEKPYTSLKQVDLTPAEKTVFVEQKIYGIAGSHNGPFIKILEVTSRGMAWLLAEEKSVKYISEILFAKNLKSSWRLVSSKNGKDILSVACFADDDSKSGFSTRFIRYSHKKNGWIKTQNIKSIDMEFEDGSDFPNLKNFPK